MNRFFLEITYDGAAFHGSQLQGEIPTVQLFINKALRILFNLEISSFGASRTDEGVHALHSYYHFETECDLIPQLLYKLNCILPESIAVKAIYKCVGEPINARFDAKSRTYRYRIYSTKNPFKLKRAHYFPYSFDRDLLNETAAVLKNYNHFESFSKRKTQSKTFLCNIMESYWEEDGDELHYVVKANRFLRGMVRGLVSTQLQTARAGTLQDFIKIIDANDCTKADFSVPGHGLYLEDIEYPIEKLVRVF